MQVRLLRETDVADFWRLRLQSLRDEPHAFGSSPEDWSGRTLEEVARDLRPTPDQFVAGAFNDAGELHGIAGLSREPRKKRHHRAGLWGMYVEPRGRRQGAARALLVEILAR